MGIGERLAEERKRKRLSQAAFAELIGVSFSSQRRYENETRDADTAYLESLRRHGVDVDYVLFGISDSTAMVSCPYLRQLAGFGDPESLPKDVGLIPLAECRQTAGYLPTHAGVQGVLHHEFCQSCPKNPIKHGLPTTQTAEDLDGALLLLVLEGFESTASTLGLMMTPSKKAQAVAMLYRSFKASGKVDEGMIEEAVKLAAI